MRIDIDVTPHLDALWRYARVLTRDDADADDLLQESLARAIRLSGSYDPSRPLLNWLVVVMRNTFLSSRRRSAAERDRIHGAIPDDETAPPSQEDRVDLAKVMRAFEGLPPDQREVLQLVAVLGFTYADAAETLGVPVGTVMSRLARGRAALKARVGYGAAAVGPKLRVVGGTDERD